MQTPYAEILKISCRWDCTDELHGFLSSHCQIKPLRFNPSMHAYPLISKYLIFIIFWKIAFIKVLFSSKKIIILEKQQVG